VIIHGLEQELGEAVVSSIGKNKATLHIEDLSIDGAPQRLVDLAVKTFGRLDAIVNNAAAVVSSNIHSTDLAFFRKVLDINTLAPFALIKAALPHLRQSKGSVLNIGSVNSYSGEPNLLAYSVSKGALMTLTRNLGDTLHREDGVRVNQINPGWVLTETETQRKRDHGLAEDWYTKVPKVYAPAGRILWPKEIAAAAIYWLADESGPVVARWSTLNNTRSLVANPPKDETTIKTKS
jgi:NAD(P)-dependent dehydrogenase (short-subunit alcohol dehydrogenase family)